MAVDDFDINSSMAGTIDTSGKTGILMATDPVKVNDTQDTYGESNLFGIRSIQYPQDVDVSGSDGYQRHFVRFSINIDEESRLIKRGKIVANPVDNSDQNRFRTGTTDQTRLLVGAGLAGAVTSLGSTVGGKLIGKQSGLGKKLAAGLAVAAGGALAGAGAISAFNVTKKLQKLAATITLYTPGNVSSHYGIEYDINDDMTNDLLAMDRGMELIKDTATGEKSFSAAASKGARLLGTAASPLLQGLTRTGRNPKKDMLFREVSQRHFQFDYVFMPKSSLEAYDVANIIYMFKYFSHPEMLEGFDQFLYLFPAEFDIEYVYKVGNAENPNQWVNKISSCVLEGIDINYASNGTFQTLVGGEPVMVTMTLRFREVETLHAGRIANGY